MHYNDCKNQWGRNAEKEFTLWSLWKQDISLIDLHSTPLWELCSLAKKAVGKPHFFSPLKNGKGLIKPRAGLSLGLVERDSRLEKVQQMSPFFYRTFAGTIFSLSFYLKFVPKHCCSACPSFSQEFCVQVIEVGN